MNKLKKPTIDKISDNTDSFYIEGTKQLSGKVNIEINEGFSFYRSYNILYRFYSQLDNALKDTL